MELFICQYNDLLPTSETRSEFNYLIQEQPSLEIISVGCEIHSTRILYSCLSISSTDRDTSSEEPTMSKDIYVSTVNLPTPPSMSHSTVNLLPLHPCQTSFYLMCNILLSISPPFIHVKFNCQFPPPPSMLYFPVSLPLPVPCFPVNLPPTRVTLLYWSYPRTSGQGPPQGQYRDHSTAWSCWLHSPSSPVYDCLPVTKTESLATGDYSHKTVKI